MALFELYTTYIKMWTLKQMYYLLFIYSLGSSEEQHKMRRQQVKDT